MIGLLTHDYHHMTGEWNTSMDEWKFGKFGDIDTVAIDTVAQLFGKRVYKMKKEVKGWKVFNYST